MSTESRSTANGDGFKRELAVIPGWAYVLAVIIFVAIPICFFGFVWRHQEEGPGIWFRTLIPFIPATFLAFLALMVGYVNRDAGRRGMSRTIWTLIVIFVPNAIGFILYFLLRSPLRSNCPKCGAVVDPRVNYCPNCRYNFHPTCTQCKAAVRPGDEFCTNCGAKLEHS